MPITEVQLPSVPDVSTIGAGPVLWLFFGLVFIMTLYYGFAQMYLWIRYGYLYPLTWLALPIYLVGVLVLLGAMAAGIAVA